MITYEQDWLDHTGSNLPATYVSHVTPYDTHYTSKFDSFNFQAFVASHTNMCTHTLQHTLSFVRARPYCSLGVLMNEATCCHTGTPLQ